MRSELASLASHPTTRFLPTPTPHTLISRSCSLGYHHLLKKKPIRRASTSIQAVDGRDHRSPIGNQEPPWLFLPPVAPQNPFSGEALLPDLRVKGTGTGIPFSLRLVQMKKRLATNWGTSQEASPLESAVGKAVSALAFMIGEMQRSVFVDRTEEEVLAKVSRDRCDAFVWLFRRVFSGSPNLVVQLLVLLAEFVVFSVGNAEKSLPVVAVSQDGLKERLVSGLQAEITGNKNWATGTGGRLPVRDIGNWSDIGIKEGSADTKDEEASVDHRRRMYEWSIAVGETNSLILSNYAQFLYRVANDHDRANQYFQWAVVAEPPDAEAMSRYALFLWEARGDISAAEEMFLEAMDADPGNHYHNSNYAWFLFKTGALDTCYPLT